MVPRSRRALLRASGIALAAGLAGCQLRQRAGNESGGGDGDGTPTTVAPGTTFDLVFENKITTKDLERASDLAADTPATVVLRIVENYEEREETIFERTVDLMAEKSQTIEDAFSTRADGPEYIVSAALESFVDPDSQSLPSTHTSAFRFTPGAFGAPTAPRFWVTVHEGEEDSFRPFITVLDRPNHRRPG